MRVCPECGKNVDEKALACSCCGFPFEKKEKIYSVSSKVMIIAFVIGLIMMIAGIKTINDPMVSFYKQHIQECEEGITDAQREKATTLITLKSGYDDIISTYERLIKDDLRKMRIIQIKGYVMLTIGLGLLVYVIYNYYLQKRRK